MKELKELSKDASDIVTAMVQKFQRMQTTLNFLFSMNQTKSLFWQMRRIALNMEPWGTNALPNAPRTIRHTLIKSQKTTNTFGSYIDTYTIEQAVKDDATIDL